MANLLTRIGRRIGVELGVLMHKAQSGVASRTLPEFATRGSGLVIDLPREIGHPERIHIGSDVKLGPNSVLKVKTHNPGSWLRHPEGDHVEQEFDAVLRIGDRVIATSALQVTAYTSVTIEDDVMLAANVFIADGTHARTRGDVPYKYQGIDRIAPVTIRKGAWIGQNVVVMPGVTIGAFALVGSNSVVTGDLPDGAIAVGSPARVVRRWRDGAWHAEAAPRRSGADDGAAS